MMALSAVGIEIGPLQAPAWSALPWEEHAIEGPTFAVEAPSGRPTRQA